MEDMILIYETLLRTAKVTFDSWGCRNLGYLGYLMNLARKNVEPATLLELGLL